MHLRRPLFCTCAGFTLASVLPMRPPLVSSHVFSTAIIGIMGGLDVAHAHPSLFRDKGKPRQLPGWRVVAPLLFALASRFAAANSGASGRAAPLLLALVVLPAAANFGILPLRLLFAVCCRCLRTPSQRVVQKKHSCPKTDTAVISRLPIMHENKT